METPIQKNIKKIREIIKARTLIKPYKFKKGNRVMKVIRKLKAK
jgi:hypothetical protein